MNNTVMPGTYGRRAPARLNNCMPHMAESLPAAGRAA